MNLINIYMHTQ